MTVIIHAGLKKCGSSSIHALLSANREKLRAAGIRYPGPARPGTDLADEIQGRRKFESAQGTLARLAQEWTAAPEAALVLSSEMLEETEQDQALRVRDALLACGKEDDFRIVVVVRDLLDLLPSIYVQNAKNGKVSESFDAFFESTVKERRVQYFQTASRWAGVFGWEAMRIRVLDREHLLNHDLLDDFLAILGIRAEALALKRPGVLNVSPGWRVAEAVRALRTGAHGLKKRHPLLKALPRNGKLLGLGRVALRIGARNGWNTDRGRYLTLPQAEQCLEIYARNVEQLNRHLADVIPEPRSLAARNFREREYLPDAMHIPADELTAFYEALLDELSASSEKRERRRARAFPHLQRSTASA